MSSLFLLFNHTLTSLQRDDACKSLSVEKIIVAPAAIQSLWSQIPPDLVELTAYIEPVCQWLGNEAEAGDFLLVQGDFGATFLLIEFARKNHLVPLYSTTERTVVEKHLEDGSVKLEHNFRHVRYRRYDY